MVFGDVWIRPYMLDSLPAPKRLSGGHAWRLLRGLFSGTLDGPAPLVVDGDGQLQAPVDIDPEAARLLELYLPLLGFSHGRPGRRGAWAQMGQSLDGKIATRTGDSFFVTGDDDRRHLHRLRALSDAVVVGAGTVVADDPQLTVRAVEGRNPVRVVLDPNARVPDHARLLRDGAAPTLVLRAPGAPVPRGAAAGVEVLRLPHGDGGFAPGGVLELLADRGLERVLVEGGGVTVSRFLCAGVLDRLFVTVAPLIIGEGRPGLQLPGCDVLREVPRHQARRFVMGEDVLFDLKLR